MTEEGVLPTPDYEILNLKQTPIPLRFTWARQAVLPCRLGVRKDVFVGPVQLRAKADVLVPSGQFVWGFSVRDRVLKGKFAVNVPGRMLAYQKSLPLPNGTFVSLSAGVQYLDRENALLRQGSTLARYIRPFYGLQFKLGHPEGHEQSGGVFNNMVWTGSGLHLRQKFPLPLGLLGLPKYPRFDVETYTRVTLPALGGSGANGVPDDGGGGFTLGQPPLPPRTPAGVVPEKEPLHIHVQGINLVMRL